MIVCGGFEDGAEVGGLLGRQRDGAADLDQLVAAVPAGDQYLWPVDGAGYAADDDLDGIATPYLSSGSIRVSRIVALGWFMGWCATRTLVEIIGSAAAVRHAETAVRALHWMHVNASVFSETPTKMVREGYNKIGPAARQYRAAVRMEMGVTGPDETPTPAPSP